MHPQKRKLLLPGGVPEAEIPLRRLQLRSLCQFLYAAGSDQEIRDSYDDEDPYENEILNDEDLSDDSEEDV